MRRHTYVCMGPQALDVSGDYFTSKEYVQVLYGHTKDVKKVTMHCNIRKFLQHYKV